VALELDLRPDRRADQLVRNPDHRRN
jgi:hypothetical protein